MPLTGTAFPRILIGQIRQKTELFANERSNRRRHLLKVFRKVAQIFQSFQQNGHALPIRIAAAASDKLQLGRSQQKMFGEFLVEVGILESRILPVHRLPRFPRRFTPLGRETRIPCRAARLSLNFSHRL
jgi:hypothetical protein